MFSSEQSTVGFAGHRPNGAKRQGENFCVLESATRRGAAPDTFRRLIPTAARAELTGELFANAPFVKWAGNKMEP